MLPSALFALTRDHGATQEDFSSLRLCRAAGDKVSAELDREFTALSGFAIDEAYGLSETGLASVSPPSISGSDRSAGQCPAVALDPERCWARSRRPAAKVAPGFAPRRLRRLLGDPEATDAAFTDGWLDTGDVLRADPDGYFVPGSPEAIIVHDGSNISPQEIEDVLLEHRASTARGSSESTTRSMERTSALTSRCARGASGRPSRADPLRAGEVGYKAPDEIVVLDEMPSTATGKVDRTGLKRMAERSLHQGLLNWSG